MSIIRSSIQKGYIRAHRMEQWLINHGVFPNTKTPATRMKIEIRTGKTAHLICLKKNVTNGLINGTFTWGGHH